MKPFMHGNCNRCMETEFCPGGFCHIWFPLYLCIFISKANSLNVSDLNLARACEVLKMPYEQSICFTHH